MHEIETVMGKHHHEMMLGGTMPQCTEEERKKVSPTPEHAVYPVHINSNM